MKLFALALLLFSSFLGYSQEAVELIESTLKLGISEEKEFYFGFAEGDQIVLNVDIVKGKKLGEIEVVEYPGTTRFTDYEAKRIKDKKLLVSKQSIYKFRFINSAKRTKIFKIRIQRIPLNEQTKSFNSEVTWKTVNDTTYQTIQEKYLERTDTTYSEFFSATPQISSRNALNGNDPRQLLTFNLPQNTVAWSFYIGVGSEGKEEYDRARRDFIRAGSKVALVIPGWGPMAALALTGVNYMAEVQGKDNVKYYFLSSQEDARLFNAGEPFKRYKVGDVITEASQMKTPLSGTVYIGLVNDNAIEPIQVTVIACAVMVTKVYGMRDKKMMNLTKRSEASLEGK
ncbi:hypothetical protein [Fluviicola sp.]|uniref:hypothetical protein n=1 Tax=Fluviicola sp. TaxID=1917219 RepID=UPI003D27B8C7